MPPVFPGNTPHGTPTALIRANNNKVIRKFRFPKKWMLPYRKSIAYHVAQTGADYFKKVMPEDTGQAKQLTEASPRGRAGQAAVVAPAYIRVINRGANPGELQPSPRDLWGWVERTFGATGVERYNLAIRISNHIREYGTRYRGFLDGGGQEILVRSNLESYSNLHLKQRWRRA